MTNESKPKELLKEVGSAVMGLLVFLAGIALVILAFAGLMPLVWGLFCIVFFAVLAVGVLAAVGVIVALVVGYIVEKIRYRKLASEVDKLFEEEDE